jgi:release factor glutamine methyltransferase
MTSQGKKGKKQKCDRGSSKPLPQNRKEELAQMEFGGIKLILFPDVYDPREDSFLLADAASELAFGKVLDLGSGSGIGGISAVKNHAVASVTFADISQKAIDNSILNCALHHISKPVLFIQTDLFSKLKNAEFDTILFNPPYLPTSKEEKLSGDINHAFDGGKSGRKVIDRFLPEFAKHLSKNGILLYLDSSLTNSLKTEKWLSSHGFRFTAISSQKFLFEEIRVLKISK